MKITQWCMTALVCAVAACEGDGSDPLVLAQGGTDYTYAAYAPNGAKVLQGVVHLQWPDVTIANGDHPLLGDWNIAWVPGADTTLRVGPQIGHGTIEGTASDDGLILSLDPTVADNNVYLHAIVDGSTIRGSWTWSTIAGPTTEGRFTALPIDGPTPALP